MVERRIAGHRVRLYDSADELPIVRFQRMQKYLLIDAGIGGDIEAFDRHTEKIRRYLAQGKTEQAGQELSNLRQCVFMVQSELNPGHRAFACLVESIDGERTEDLSDAGLERVLRMLGGMTAREAAAETSAVKKKIDAELMAYFPALFEASETKEYYDLVRRRALRQLEGLCRGEVADVDDLTTAIVCFASPKSFAGAGGEEVRMDRNFETICLSLSEVLHVNPKGCTVLEFYNAVEFLQERARRAERAKKRP